jgi:hypothetical protein
MKIGTLEVVFHRTVRVADGRVPSNLPPSLGTMKVYKVADYKDRCPKEWDEGAFFVALHDTEALWISFRSSGVPVAVLVGAGGINALTGEKLGTKLEKDNYLVAPPQPWLDGWKSDDGCVYQFVATPHKKGKGITVAEQLIGAESKTGAIGLAVFEPKDIRALKTASKPIEGYGDSPTDNDFTWSSPDLLKSEFNDLIGSVGAPTAPKCMASQPTSFARAVGEKLAEMGIGKGGRIHQKIYPDPYGIEVWQDAPVAALAIYIVNAKAFEEITGETIPQPVGHEKYKGLWFGLKDHDLQDVAGTSKFGWLKSVFLGDVSNVSKEEESTEKGNKEKETKKKVRQAKAK